MRQRGFTYIGLLLLVAMLGAGLAGAGTLWSTESRREKEAELLFVGEQYRQAIAAFRNRTPAGQQPRFPRNLEELLDDRRWPTTRRHLRKLFADPVTGTREWGFVRTPGGEITGAHSLSDRQPMKRGGFTEVQAEFQDAATYADWRFVYQAPEAAPAN